MERGLVVVRRKLQMRPWREQTADTSSEHYNAVPRMNERGALPTLMREWLVR